MITYEFEHARVCIEHEIPFTQDLAQLTAFPQAIPHSRTKFSISP